MFVRFTPNSVVAAYQRRTIAFLIICSLILSSAYYLFAATSASATSVYTWDQNNFSEGVMATTTITSGEVTLQADSITDSTEEDFRAGRYTIGTRTSQPTEGGLGIGQLYYTNKNEMPGLDYSLLNIEVAVVGDIMYMTSAREGVLVLDTKGTTEFSDDEIIGSYNTSSTPALPVVGNVYDSNYINDIFYDETNSLLYIGTWSAGVSVINTNGTAENFGDDSLLFTYRNNTTPALLSNRVRSIYVQDDLIFVGSDSGLAVIDRNDTFTTTDDVRVGRYTLTTAPALGGYENRAYASFLDNGLLYVGTSAGFLGGGLSVFDTMGTMSTSTDDVRVAFYSTSTTPALNSPSAYGAEKRGDYIYIPYNDLIDTKGTANQSDDELVAYRPDLFLGNIVDSYIFRDDLLSVNTTEDIFVFNTYGTNDIADDELVFEYPNMNMGPFLNFASINDTYYFNSYNHLFSLKNNLEYPATSTYESVPRRIADVNISKILASTTVSSDQSVTMWYRTGTTSAAWRDDFDTTGSHVGDFYNWDAEFQTAVAEDGVLKLSNPVQDTYAYNWFATGFPEGYFATSTKVSGKIRLVCGSCEGDETYYLSLFTNDYVDDDFGYFYPNTWNVLNFTNIRENISNIGTLVDVWPLEILSSATLEIDWMDIITPDTMGLWNEWQPCSSLTSCEIDPAQLDNNEWIQYRLDLSTDDPESTPVVHSVSFVGDYMASGVYTSDREDFSKTRELLTFSAEQSVPASTTASYEYSLDGGTVWNAITPGSAFARGTTAESFRWRVTLTSEDAATAPRVAAVTLTTANVAKETTSTMVRARVDSLEASGLSEEAAYLRRTFPEIFDENGEATTEAVQYGILVRIEKILDLMERMRSLK